MSGKDISPIHEDKPPQSRGRLPPRRAGSNHAITTDEQRAKLIKDLIDTHSIETWYKHIRFNLRVDEPFMIVAVEKDGLALQYAAEKLRGKKQVVLAAVKNNGLALAFATEELQLDDKIVEAAVKNNGLALEFYKGETRSSKITEAAVKQNGLALKFATGFDGFNETIAKAAIEENGLALEFVNDRMKNDKKIVKDAVRQDARAFQFASAELKDDRSFFVDIVNINGKAMEYVTDELFTNRSKGKKIPQQYIDALVNTQGGKEVLHKWVVDEEKKNRLQTLVKQAPRDSIFNVTDAKERRAIDTAIPVCKGAMEAAGKFLNKFDDVSHISVSDTTYIVKAFCYDDDNNKKAAVALKFVTTEFKEVRTTCLNFMLVA